MKVVSFNIRTLWQGDGINSYMHRLGLIYEKISREAPDIIGFQEMQAHHVDTLTKLFPEYSFFGNGRNEGYEGEGLYIAVKRQMFDIVASRLFWLSPTPNVPASRFPEQSIYPRICVSVTLHHKPTGKRVSVYNVHLDHLGLGHTEPPSSSELPENVKVGESIGARADGIAVALSEMRADYEKTGIPMILMGDFNSKPFENVIELCREFPLTDVSENLDVTFHAFGKTEKYMKIDYIFLSEELAELASPAVLWDDEKNGIYLSDHYPIATEIDF